MTVIKGDKEDGNTVAFKVNVPDDSCPGSLDDVDFSFTTQSGKLASWDQTPESWTVGGCVVGWTLFQRDQENDNAVICMKVINQTHLNQTMARLGCEAISQGLEVTVKLTGVASVEECRWIYNHLSELDGVFEWAGVWIDGDRKCTPETASCQEFDWSDGYTKGKHALSWPNANTRPVVRSETTENCLSISYMPTQDASATINDLACKQNDHAVRGFVCGYRLD